MLKHRHVRGVVTAAGLVTAVATLTAQQAPTRGTGARPPAAAVNPTAIDVFETSILDLQAALAEGRTSSRALVDAYLARIAAYDSAGPGINAVVTLNPRARDEADALDQERRTRGSRGPLHGIPVLVKDNYDTADMPTSAGALGLATHRPDADAFQVARLRAAGAIILGKTTMHELAYGITTQSSLTGQTRNPYDLGRAPGGSSGGTGAAIAASFAAAGMGSDTCGSIRIPSSHNNLVGLRGTQGLSSRTGIVPLSHTQDIGGPLARSVADLAIMLDATVGADPADPSTAESAGRIPKSYLAEIAQASLNGVRVGVLGSLFGNAPEDQEVATVVRRALDELKKSGAELVEVSVPGLDDLLRDSSVINDEFKFDLQAYLARTPGAPVHSLADILDRGLHHTAVDAVLRRSNAVESPESDHWRRALVKRMAARAAVVATLDEHALDAVAYPTIRRKPATIGEPQSGSNCQMSASSGLPAVSMPAGFTPDGLPVGVELLGRAFAESTLLRIARASEELRQPRRAPFSTPPLIDGRAPSPVSFSVGVPPAPPTAGRLRGRGRAVPTPATSASGLPPDPSVSVAFTYDVTRGSLTYSAQVRDLGDDRVIALALHRAGEAARPGPVLMHVLRMDQTRGDGVLDLGGQARQDLTDGRLYLQLYTLKHPLGAQRLAVGLP